jgi:hypothetical protein
VRSTESGAEVRLTTDGERDRAYATPVPSPTLMVRERTSEPDLDPLVFWSPDSRRLATYRIDARGAGTLSMVQHAPPDRVRPRHYTYRYPLPEDSVLPTGDPFSAVDGARPVPIAGRGGTQRLGAAGLVETAAVPLIATDRGYTRQRWRRRDRRAARRAEEARSLRMQCERSSAGSLRDAGRSATVDALSSTTGRAVHGAPAHERRCGA